MKTATKAWLVYLTILAACLFTAYAISVTACNYDDAKARRERQATYDKARRFDRACTSIVGTLKLALQRVRATATAEAGRDIAVVIAPVVAQCAGIPAHQSRLESLATSSDAARDAAVIQGILDEIAKVERP